MDTVFFESTGDRHAWMIGGLSALERRIREVARQGAARAVVAASPVALPRPLPIPVEFVAVGSPPPEGARRERADVIAGIELGDEAARRRAEWAVIRRMNKSFEGPVDALINWRFSMRITRLLARRSLAVTPNHVTIAAIAVGLVAALAREPRRVRAASRSPACCWRSTRSSTRATASSRGCATSTPGSASGSTTCRTTSSTTCS